MQRRRLLKLSLAVTLGSLTSSAALPGVGSGSGEVVVVRQGDALVTVDPATGRVIPCGRDMAVGSPETGLATPAALPAALTRSVPGEIDYWMATPGQTACIGRVVMENGDPGWWRWDGAWHRIELPPDLEPGLPSGTVAWWFHGALIEADHLGSGSLRLLAVEIATGTIVLDDTRDRRLELASTAIGDGGATVAHLQGGNTQVELWMADLRRRETAVITVPLDPPAPVAPSEIELDVSGTVVAAGLAWSSWDHHAPTVLIAEWSADDPVVRVVPGRLEGLGSRCV